MPTAKKNMAAKNNGRNRGRRGVVVLRGESVALTVHYCTEPEKSMNAFHGSRGTLGHLAASPVPVRETMDDDGPCGRAVNARYLRK